MTRSLLAAMLAVLAIPPVSFAQVQRTARTTDAAAWFNEPCLPDSADSYFWTRYDLHGIRIRIPPEVRHVKAPDKDELHFRLGQATMRLRLQRDASRLFAEVYTPQQTRKHCWADLSGLLAEVISFGTGGAGSYGFAARWADADRGEWLTAIIAGSRAADVTLLRKTLFTIVFPDSRSGG